MKSIFGLSLISILVGAAPSMAADRCTGFKWDVSRELALFDQPSVALNAGENAADAPVIGTDRLYELRLAPQSTVSFAAAPGRNGAADGVHAGLAQLRLPEPGNYRVAVDAPLWIDVTFDGKLAAVTDFQGQQNCDGPHKIVEFDLSAARRFVLQLSGSARATVRLTVTRTPPRKL